MTNNTDSKNLENEDKKKIILRLCIFVLIAMLPGIIGVAIINNYVGGKLYTVKGYDSVVGLVSITMMMLPSIAHLLTRLITKEGWKESYLWPNMKGNVKYYLAAIWVILAQAIVFGFIAWRIFAPELSISDLYHFEKNGVQFATILFTLANVIFLFFPYFGEEWGWRGYMMPKLIKLMGKPAAVIVGGVIWGLWHAPLTVSGHNFGTDYPGYPWVGIGYMCVFCILQNAFLTYITEKSKTIYPATICHGVIDSLGYLYWMILFSSEKMIDKISQCDGFKVYNCMFGVCAVVAVISMALLVKKPMEGSK